ncbi:MAG TPA: DNA methyltransferase [Labilithrix sp.]
MTEVRRRRSLTNVGGVIDKSGDRTAADALAHALAVPPSEKEDAPDRAHVHGFHAYPARAHPVTARRLVEAFAPARGLVLDPFCGSGTVLVEAMLANRDVVGTDLNPLGIMLARAKTYPHPPAKTAALVEAARAVADFADVRRKAKAGATRRLPREDVALFPPHVLLELDSIRAGIAQKAPPETRPELLLVLSSLLVKLSSKRGDTSDETQEKRIAAGRAAKLFVAKTEELARRFDEFAAALPAPPPRARVYLDDAMKLGRVEGASVDAVVTSPPYVATYDYLSHHDLRMRWLGLDAAPLEKGELGARRRYARLDFEHARDAWKEELATLLRSLARVTKPDAPVALLIADSAIGGGRIRPQALRADALVSEVARTTGLFEPVARASQARPHFHAPTASAFRDAARAEHAILLRRAKGNPA